jgi:hypothetical protein
METCIALCSYGGVVKICRLRLQPYSLRGTCKYVHNCTFPLPVEIRGRVNAHSLPLYGSPYKNIWEPLVDVLKDLALQPVKCTITYDSHKFGPNMVVVLGVQIKSHNKGLLMFLIPPRILFMKMFKSRKLWWILYIASMRRMRCLHSYGRNALKKESSWKIQV